LAERLKISSSTVINVGSKRGAQNKTAIHDNLIEAVLVVGLLIGQLMAESVAAAWFNKKGPTIIDVDQADDNLQGCRPSRLFFGGSPKVSAKKVITLPGRAQDARQGHNRRVLQASA
jgi:hypothetical protein